jgi:hypothetical protein
MAQSLSIFLLDPDEASPLHVCAYQGSSAELSALLQDAAQHEQLDRGVRPLLATPLRLAATGEDWKRDLNCVKYIDATLSRPR